MSKIASFIQRELDEAQDRARAPLRNALDTVKAMAKDKQADAADKEAARKAIAFLTDALERL